MAEEHNEDWIEKYREAMLTQSQIPPNAIRRMLNGMARRYRPWLRAICPEPIDLATERKRMNTVGASAQNSVASRHSDAA